MRGLAIVLRDSRRLALCIRRPVSRREGLTEGVAFSERRAGLEQLFID
jgi:hypothetical protein